jgi:ribosomal protein L18E
VFVTSLPLQPILKFLGKALTLGCYQGDQKFWKKVAQTVAKPKTPKQLLQAKFESTKQSNPL